MRYLTYAILIIINFLLQTTLFEHIAIFSIKPNTMIILIVSFAFMRGDLEGSLIGFFSGLLIDSFFGNFLGLNAIIGFFVGFFAGKMFQEYYKNVMFIPFILVALFDFLYGIGFFFFNVLLRGEPNILPFLTKIILPEVLYTSLISIILYKILYYINIKLDKLERKKKNIFR